LKSKSLIHNARIYTQAGGVVADSMALSKGRVVAVGKNLTADPEFKNYDHVDLKGLSVFPGFVDAHTHFYYFALSLRMLSLQGVKSLKGCLDMIAERSSKLKRGDWLLGEGLGPNWFKDRAEPTREMLDAVCPKHPLFVFSKDEHSAYVNSKALQLAGLDKKTRDPKGGKIERDADGRPNGILRERAGYMLVHDLIPSPSPAEKMKLWKQALEYAYSKGVTGVHSFDGPEGFAWYQDQAEKGKLGLRVNYYPHADLLPALKEHGSHYGMGDDWLRLAGIKIFADGALGSLTAHCFNKYIGTKDNYGIEVTTVPQMKKIMRAAHKLGFPCAIHGIGDKAVASILDVYESGKPLSANVRHRIEHAQLLRRKDIARIKRLGVVCSMQPSHLPLDIKPIREFWGARGKNAFIHRTLLDRKIDLAFGSDVPIEPLDPIAGIDAAVRRVRPGTRDAHCPEERITAAEAVYAFTVGTAIACGQSDCRGYLLPGYPADFVVLSQDITKVAPTKVGATQVLATVIDGKVKFSENDLNI